MKQYLIGLLIIIFASCGTMGGKPIYPAKVTSQMQSAFNVAEGHYNNQRYRSALEAYQTFIKTYEHTRLTDESHYKISKIYFLHKKWDEVIAESVTLANKTPDPEQRAKALLMASHASFEKEDYSSSQDYLKKIGSDDLSSRLQLRYYSLKVLVGEKLENSKQEVDYAILRIADLYNSTSDSQLSQLKASEVISESEVMRRLRSWIISPISINDIPSWFRDYPRGFSKGYVDYKWGKIYVEAGETERAKRQLSYFIQTNPKHEYVESAKKLLQDLGGEVKTSTSGALKIGVILPLSGPRGMFGEAALKGIKCAAHYQNACSGELQNQFEKESPVELIIKDSGSQEERVIQLIDELAEEDVAAIIGPMSGSLSVVAAKRAQELRVPIFPITQKSDIMRAGSYVFQMGYEVNRQIADIVKVARNQGLKTFGIFYPQSSYGTEMADLFTKEVESQGGRIVAKTSYDPTSLDLADEARSLKLGITRYSYAGKSAGFEGLFIPDSYRVVNRLISVLPYVTIEAIPLIGTNAWNDPHLLTAGLYKSFPNSFYVDLFYDQDSNPLTLLFRRSFESSFGSLPTSVEALGFDAVWFVRQVAKSGGSHKPSHIQEGLLHSSNLEGVTRIKSFEQSQGPSLKPLVLKPGETGIIVER